MNKKGFTLIETILYISLLSFIMIGIFSNMLFYMQASSYRPRFTDNDYQILISNFHEE